MKKKIMLVGMFLVTISYCLVGMERDSMEDFHDHEEQDISLEEARKMMSALATTWNFFSGIEEGELGRIRNSLYDKQTDIINKLKEVKVADALMLVLVNNIKKEKANGSAILKFLLEEKILSPNKILEYGITYKSFETVLLALAAGADVNYAYKPTHSSWDGEIHAIPALFNALRDYLACSKDDKDDKKVLIKIIHLLAEKGARFDYVNQHNQTILHYAVQVGDVHFVKRCLKKHKEYLNELASGFLTIGIHDSITPLGLAIEACNLEIVTILLEQRASVNVVYYNAHMNNNHKRSAVEYAQDLIKDETPQQEKRCLMEVIIPYLERHSVDLGSFEELTKIMKTNKDLTEREKVLEKIVKSAQMGLLDQEIISKIFLLFRWGFESSHGGFRKTVVKYFYAFAFEIAKNKNIVINWNNESNIENVATMLIIAAKNLDAFSPELLFRAWWLLLSQKSIDNKKILEQLEKLVVSHKEKSLVTEADFNIVMAKQSLLFLLNTPYKEEESKKRKK